MKERELRFMYAFSLIEQDTSFMFTLKFLVSQVSKLGADSFNFFSDLN